MKIEWIKEFDSENHKEHVARVRTKRGTATARVTLSGHLGTYTISGIILEKYDGMYMLTKVHKNKSYGSYSKFNTAMKHFRKAQCEVQKVLRELE